MNTVQHKKSMITRHELVMYGPITARDLGDFIHQVDSKYQEITGHATQSDDAYYVTGNEDGLTATFETKEATA